MKVISDKIVALDISIGEKNKQIEEMSKKILNLEKKLAESEEKETTMEKLEEKLKAFDKKFEEIEKKIDYFSNFVGDACVQFDDLVVELNDDIGNITFESEDNMLLKTFNNPVNPVGFKCDICEFAAKSERGLKTHKTRKHFNCDWCDYICDDEKEIKKHKFDKHTMEYGAELLQDCYL